MCLHIRTTQDSIDLMTNRLKPTLKALRNLQPFNAVATTTVRAISHLFRRDIELAIKHLPRVGHTRAVLPNRKVMRLWSRGDDWVSNQVYWRGWSGYESEMSPIFYQFARSADVVVDVGAHVGFFSILAAYANPYGQVFAFEPLPAVYQRLQRNVAINRLPNVTVIQSAVSSEVGEANFFHVPAAVIPSSSSLSLAFMQAGNDRVVSTRVSILKLDDYLQDHAVDHIDLVKLDTETTEVDVLDGMRERLSRDQPAIFCEVLKRCDVVKLAELLSQYGYRYFLLTSAGPVARAEIIADGYWPNYLFVARPEHCEKIDRW